VIKRISHFNSKLVAIDKPAPSYKPDIVYSLIYPKTSEAEVIEISVPKELNLYVGPGEVEALFKPKASTYKTKNGKLLFILNSDDIASVETLLKVANTYLVNVSIYNLNKDFESRNISKLLTNYEIIDDSKLDEAILEIDSIYFGSFKDVTLINRALIYEVMRYKARKYILYGDSLNYINPNDLTDYVDLCVVPSKEQSHKFLTNKSLTFRSMALDYVSCFVELGLRNTIYSPKGDLRFASTNALTRKINQDFFASLTAVLSTKNDMWLSLRAAMFLTEQLAAKNMLTDNKLLEEILIANSR
jgi:hypothetical protein